MTVDFYANGKTVYEKRTYSDGTEQTIKVRDCNTNEEAIAVANYCKVRKE